MEAIMQRKLEFQMCGRLFFGTHVLAELPNVVRRLGGKRPFLVTDQGVSRSGITERVGSVLKQAGIEYGVFDHVEPDPSIENLYLCLEKAKAFDCDLLIGLGGGSSQDISKLVSILLVHDQDVRNFVGIDKIPSRGLKKITIPTTSGSGSEVTPIAILSDKSNQLKKGIVSEYLYPDVALIDPELTVSLPPNMTAYTGIDALTHAIEAYTNRYAQPFIDMYALEGIRLIGKYLLRAVNNGSDLDARYYMSMASFCGGLCLGSVNTAAVHALAYPLGGMFNVPHGIANSLLLPHVMKFNMNSNPEKFSQIAVALGQDLSGLSLSERAERSIDAVVELCKKSGIVSTLRQLNIPQNSIDTMATGAMQVTRLLGNNPREVTIEDVKKIYQDAY
jgi:alcohol dehydrogenase class IV